MPPDRVPSLFPERPIRPLPKRKLREKLSPEAIQTIEYPPATVKMIPALYYPVCSARITLPDLSKATGEPYKPANRKPDIVESSYLHGRERLASASSVERHPRQPPEENTKYNVPFDQGDASGQKISAASSRDVYDSLENTNNKKKRKIPSASDSVLRGSLPTSGGSVEMPEAGSGMDAGVQATAPAVAVSGPLPTHNDGISGSGRGRLGRTVHARSPLRTLSDGNNLWPIRPPKTGVHYSGAGHGTSGIISNAIANAERLAPSGQENAGSLLRHHFDSAKTTPIASQFTFTCGLQVTGTASWPDTSLATSGSAECPLPVPLNQGKGTPADAASNNKATREGRRRSRPNSHRQIERDIMLAARDRRQAAVDAYHNSPPRLEDVWICEFCEYERIFGSPPKALIREYEMKDHRNRQEEADRRRLLEKAKAKSRKGRKGNKVTKGTQFATQSPDRPSEGPAVAEPHAMEPSQSHSTQSEVNYEDKVDGFRPRDPPDILGLHENGSTLENVPIVRA